MTSITSTPQSRRAWRALGILVVAAIALLVPFVLRNYQILQATMVVSYSIALLGLNILTGYNGQISLGQGAFYGLGAYLAALFMIHTGIPYWATIPLVGAICLATGFLFGLPALRLEGLYLALATFALAVALPQILKHPALKDWTGGFQGLTLRPVLAPSFLPLNPDQWLYLFSVLVMAVVFLIAWNLLRGRTGRAMVAIREHPIAALSMGINIGFYKSMTFGVSAMFAGVAGALGAFAAQFVSPDSFTFFLSITLLVGIVVGGIASLSGAILGAIFIEFVPDFAEQISSSAPWAIYGVVIIVCVYLFPRGAVGLMESIYTASFRWRRRLRDRASD